MSTTSPEQNELIAARLQDTEGINRAMKRAARAALESARRAGVPVVVWRNGRVEHVSAEELLAEEAPSPEM